MVGFHLVTAEAASGYVLSSEKLNPERWLEDDVDQFSEINIRLTFLGKRESNRGNRMGKAASSILTACEVADVIDGLIDR